jgi:phage terminase large subunit GpA-like protein
VDLFLVGVDEAKLTLMHRLTTTIENKTGGGAGVCHFPHGRPVEWFRQLTAEKLVTRYVKGQPVREWTKADRARNEATDCRVYAMAALKIIQPNLKRMAERLGAKPPSTPPTKSTPPPIVKAEPEISQMEAQPRPNDSQPKRSRPQPKRRGGFVSNW